MFFKSSTYEKYFINIFKKFYLNIKNCLSKLNNLEKTNLDLGIFHLNKSNISDAIFRFKLIKFFNRNNYIVDYYLGKSYFINKNLEKSRILFNDSINHNINIEESKYFLSIIDKNYDSIIKIPISIIQEYYNLFLYPNKFIEEESDIDFITKIKNYLPVKNSYKTLDLGIGNGDIGSVLKKTINCDITGIDISDRSTEIVKSRKEEIYQNLINGDFYNSLNQQNKYYDIIIAKNSICFNKDLSEIISLIEKNLIKESIFAFIVEKSKNNSNNLDANNIYYNYNREYIESVIAKYKLNIVSIDENNINQKIYINVICIKL